MKFLLFILCFICFSCASPTQETSLALHDSSIDVHRGTDAQHTIQRFSLEDVKIDLSKVETLQLVENALENEDAVTIYAINSALLGAEKETQLLDVKFSMSDEPVENGTFIFGIETAIDNELELQMLDEEGYLMVANNSFTITKGENYKALNVNGFANGQYVFRLVDKNGFELTKTVKIQK